MGDQVIYPCTTIILTEEAAEANKERQIEGKKRSTTITLLKTIQLKHNTTLDTVHD